MGNLGFWEIVVLGVIALLVFGPERLPGMARTVGRTLAQFKREANATLQDLRDAAAVEDDVKAITAEMKAVRQDFQDVRRTVNTPLPEAAPTDTRPAPFDDDAT